VQTRVIVFIRFRSQANSITRELGCLKYYSDSSTEEEKATVLIG